MTVTFRTTNDEARTQLRRQQTIHSLTIHGTDRKVRTTIRLDAMYARQSVATVDYWNGSDYVELAQITGWAGTTLAYSKPAGEALEAIEAQLLKAARATFA